MTFRRWFKRKRIWLYAKIVRDGGTPESVARGWAIGMFCGCFIPFGFQLVASVPLAIATKASKVGAVVGTFLTNHFTIFFIYPVQVWVGLKILGGGTGYGEIRESMRTVVEEQTFESLAALGGEVAAAFFIGGFLLAAVCTPPTYFGVLRATRRFRERKAAAVAAKRANAAVSAESVPAREKKQ